MLHRALVKYLIRVIGRHLAELLHPIILSMPSAIWLLPRASVWNDTILVQTPTHDYTANDYQDLFRDIGQEKLFTMYNGVKDINPDFPAPNVSSYLLLLWHWTFYTAKLCLQSIVPSRCYERPTNRNG